MSNAVLDCPMDPDTNDAGASTVREYLVALLAELWKAGEGFSGKRPFGNSGWEFEVYQALVAAELVEGAIDDDGYLDECDSSEADRLVRDAISALAA
jgi:hypothetical protein